MAVVAYQRRAAILRYVFTYGLHHNATLWTDLHVLSICDCFEKLEADRQFGTYDGRHFSRIHPYFSVELTHGCPSRR